MIFRRIKAHIAKEDWFAVFIDFLIVMVGILIAFQITNWNEGRALDSQEKELLIELKREIEGDAANAEILRDHFKNVHAAAKRSINFIDSGGNCGDACWPVLADFFHASHWFPVAVKRSIFDEMRRQGLPRSRKIVAAVESYHSQNYNNAVVLVELPAYRKLVRSIIPISVHEAYWSTCWSLSAGVETIRYNDCRPSVSNDIAAQTVKTIVQHPDIRSLLTFWFSEITPTADELAKQNEAARRAMAMIDNELEKM